ncbi:MAG: hypothetical protein NTV25_06055 [Methanothrix sp.]|nr:hypothetical protein [Methanothrix sp.]
MSNELFREIVSSKIDAAIDEAKKASGVTHSGVKGSIREITLKNLFKPLLTAIADLGTGTIIDSKGNQSQETDIIIYSRDILPPILFYDKSDTGIYPAETCIYAVEVKSKATAANLRDALEKAETLRRIAYVSGFLDPAGRPVQHELTPIVPAFFAFDSDLTETGKSELERYLELDRNGNINPFLRAICVVGRGYWYFHPETIRDGTSTYIKGTWWYWESTSKHDEVISFLSGILNTIPRAIASRGRPALGEYLIPINLTYSY